MGLRLERTEARSEPKPRPANTGVARRCADGDHGSSRRCSRAVRAAAVIQQRMEFHEVMRDRFTGVIQDATGRTVERLRITTHGVQSVVEGINVGSVLGPAT